MAKIDKDDSGENIINISAKVGVRGINDSSDVMVIQAMLNYLLQLDAKWTKVAIPAPNGALDKDTVQAIFDYQQFVRNRQDQLNVWVAKDGAISPFKSGVKLLHRQQWTIISMNDDCATLSAALDDGEGHIDAIIRRWPFTVGAALSAGSIRCFYQP